ncbi:MAG: divergent polysaccharide deacetylase family protein [Flexistipes sinusarabici]|uniref:Divergent polysaccharide deacetylase family protein n=1 Tax=Flexistipes sinusarabici TaxID=2352 RepID=A0A5D0MQ48_FLESI|nr:divergent polysaccharide deacetylase family protein [Flexistipes sinusarabici]TYB33773.1 MAG: divergent polysaccharide deacetylase family protein [Flexistipes sinusarabici]
MARKKQPSKKNNSKNRRKKKSGFKIPPFVIVGGIFLIMIGIITASIVNIRLQKLQTEYSGNEKSTVKVQSSSEIEKKIKLFLYDHEISKDRVVSKNIKKTKKADYLEYTIQISEYERDSLRNSLINFFTKNNFDFSEENALFFHKPGLNITFNLKAPPVKENYTDNYDINSGNIDYKANMAIILDDSGYNLDLAEKAASIKYPLTLSIIPYTPYDSETAEIARKHDKTVFLHLPMQPKSYPDTEPGKGAILLNTPETLIKILVDKNVEQIGKIDGVNNHMGSALTENRLKMTESLKYIKKYTNTFVDSHTSADTVAYNICKEMKMNCGISEKFIDNNGNLKYIKNKLIESAELAIKQKDLIVIGHLRPKTVNALIKFLPEVEQMGVKIVPIQKVIQQ